MCTETGNGGSVEKHGEWETSCRVAFVTPTDGMQRRICQACEGVPGIRRPKFL